VLPENLRYLASAFGLFLLPAMGALVWGLRRRLLLPAALAPHLLGSVLFFSCWGHSDPRYLMGAVLALEVLTVAGTAGWCATLADARHPARTRVALVAVTIAATLAAPVLFPPKAQRRPLEVAAGAGAVGMGLAGFIPPLAAGTAAIAPLVPALVFAGVGVARVATGTGARDPFQAPQVARARAALEALVPPDALVLTTPALGRPAENITRYTHADAHYAGEATILRSTPVMVARRADAAGRRMFLLLPGSTPPPLPMDALTEVARRRGLDLYDWFVDPAHAAEAVLFEVVRVPEG